MSWNTGNAYNEEILAHPDYPGSMLLGSSKGKGDLFQLPTEGDGNGHDRSGPSIGVDDLSPDQREAYDEILAWYGSTKRKRESSALTMGGYAGSGKSSLVSIIASEIGADSIAFCAFAGKAANVLRTKLREAGIEPGYCGTLHGLIYRAVTDRETGRLMGFARKKDHEVHDHYSLVVLDEASMVHTEMYEELLSFGVPVLAVGDHGQLPPVGNDAFSPVEDPDIRLERVHRQALESPIIRVATAIREGRDWRAELGPGDNEVLEPPAKEFARRADLIYEAPDDLLRYAMLVGFNSTRQEWNDRLRETVGLSAYTPLQQDDVLVCLRNTWFHPVGVVYNGMRGRVVGPVRELDNNRVETDVEFPDEGLVLRSIMSAAQLGRRYTIRDWDEAKALGHGDVKSWAAIGMLMDYGGALTVHKAQGSQWDTVVVREEKLPKKHPADHRRWAYTAATRAERRLVWISR